MSWRCSLAVRDYADYGGVPAPAGIASVHSRRCVHSIWQGYSVWHRLSGLAPVHLDTDGWLAHNRHSYCSNWPSRSLSVVWALWFLTRPWSVASVAVLGCIDLDLSLRVPRLCGRRLYCDRPFAGLRHRSVAAYLMLQLVGQAAGRCRTHRVDRRMWRR